MEMPVYLIAAVNIHDDVQYEEYIRQSWPTFEGVEVKMLALSNDVEALEGSNVPNRIALLEFPDRASIEAWYQSEAYQKNAVPVRHAAADTQFMAIVDAYEPPAVA